MWESGKEVGETRKKGWAGPRHNQEANAMSGEKEMRLQMRSTRKRQKKGQWRNPPPKTLHRTSLWV